MNTTLPPGLPVPVDDGAAAHLPGKAIPPLSLPSTDGSAFPIDRPPLGFDSLVLYAYPRTGRPGEPELTPDWDSIPGARGCTPEACGFRDHARELAAFGAAVAGVSTQPTEEQREVVERLELPFPLLSDEDLRMAKALDLPTFDFAGRILLKRLTMIVREGVVQKVFYPVFPPDRHAEEVLGWLRSDGGSF
ncbi:MAG TPA: peroxiredoxin [Actinomycetota bacterium]|jgi:peroxiredoxin